MTRKARLRTLPLSLVSLLSLNLVLPACSDVPGVIPGEDDDASSGGKASAGGGKGSGGNGLAGEPGSGGEGSKPAGGQASTGGHHPGSGGADESGGALGLGGEPEASGGAAAAGGQGAESGGAGTGGETSSSGGAASGGAASGGSSSGGQGSGGEPGATGGSGSGPLAIERAHETLLLQIKDIRGLGYAKNGDLYASGYRLDELGDAWVSVLRLRPDGTLDESFGTGGMADFNLVERVVEVSGDPPASVVKNDGAENSFGVVELASGDVIVQVAARQEQGAGMWVGLVRLNAQGQLVSSFGAGGVVQAKFGYELADAAVTPFNDSSWGLALDAESSPGTEKVVVFGSGTAAASTGRTDNDRYVTRLLAEDGSMDSGFNSGSALFFNTADVLSDGARRGILLPGGGILSSGYTNFGTGQGNHVVLIQLTPSGALDSSFGFGGLGDGVAKFNPFLVDGGVSECYAVARQSSGRFVTTGYGAATAALTGSTLGYLTSIKQDMVSFGVLPRGLDPLFANSGHLAVQSEDDPPTSGLESLAAERFEERGRDLLTLADDRVVYAGRYDLRPALMVGRARGGLDETVGDNLTGRFSYDAVPPDTAHFYSITQSQDGRRVAAATNAATGVTGVLIAVLRIGAP